MKGLRKSRKRGPVRARKCQADGIFFQSGLEKYMYTTLKANGLFEFYEGEVFQLMEPFQLSNQCIERQGNGKGEMKQRSTGIRGISYTPDFTGKDYIIETKGRANESFPMRWKLFKKWLFINKDERMIFKPQNQAECLVVVKMILKARSDEEM